MKVYILDDELSRVPILLVNYVYLGIIANGYLNREEETSKAFIANIFDGGIMYRTGDMVAFYLPDGFLGIIGCPNGQVKIRGNGVELTNVEEVILELDYIEEVIAQRVNRGDENGLAAYIVVSKEIQNLKDSICHYVANNKPNYMVLSFVTKLDNIPLNTNGKVDKTKLPKEPVAAENIKSQNKENKNYWKYVGKY